MQPAPETHQPTIHHTREQLYAAAVYEQFEQFLKQNRSIDDRKKYRSIILAAPALVHNAGLAQALAFIASRNEPLQCRLVADIAGVVLGVRDGAQLLERSRGGTDGSLRDYMLLTRQVLAALLWYRRYAQQLLGNTDTTTPVTEKLP
jgi:CRISPR-associated protein Cmr5